MALKVDTTRCVEAWALKQHLQDEPTESEMSGYMEELEVQPNEEIQQRRTQVLSYQIFPA